MEEKFYFNISSFFASAIVNGDFSGLTDDEGMSLSYFLRDLENTYGNCDLHIEDYWNLKPVFTKCEVTKLLSDCVEFYLTATEEV
jgi:hypothetical protein